MNFTKAVKEGQLGKNIGLPTGLKKIDRVTFGIQRKAVYVIAAGPKV